MNILWTKPSLSRDFALLAGLIVFILVLVSIWVSYESFDAHSDKVIKQLEGEATRIDRSMIIEIERASYLIESLGRQIAQTGTDNLDTIAALLKSFDTNAIANNVLTLADGNQMVVVSSNKGVLARTVDVADRDYIKKSLAEPWKVQIGRPIQGRVSEKWVLPVAMGIMDNSGKYLGTISISLDIASLSRELQSVVKKSGISFAIFSKTLVLLTDNDGHITDSDFFMNQLKKMDFNKNPSGILSLGSLFVRDKIYAYYETSANYPYVIVLGYDSTLSDSSIRNLILPKILQLTLMAVFMLSLLWMVKARVIKPILDLTAIAQGVARGQPFTPIAQNSPMEVELLSYEIRKLSEFLAERKRISDEKENKNLMLKRAKEHAELSNRIKVEFLTAMSHEFRTPLNNIVGFSEIMKNELYGSQPNTQYSQYTQDIFTSARRLQDLVEDVLALSAAEDNLSELQEKTVDIRLIVNKSLRVLAQKLQQLQVSVDVQAPDMLPRLLVDEVRLKQIVVNLIFNAALHTPAGGNVVVRIGIEKDKHSQEFFVISFTDFGSKTGVVRQNPDLQQVPLHLERKGRGDHASLSIPLTKALVTMLHATLDVSIPPGKATTISVKFPKARIVE